MRRPQLNIYGTGSNIITNNSSPTVDIEWSNSLTIEDRFCSSGVCGYLIKVNANDIDGDTLIKQVLISTDFGLTWNSYISNLIGISIFGDSINSIGSKWYQVRVSDSINPDVYSNILKYSYNGSYPLQYFYYEGIWSCPDNIHDPEINAWVDYIDENGNQQREIIGCAENGCVELIANSIINTNGVSICSPVVTSPLLSLNGLLVTCSNNEIGSLTINSNKKLQIKMIRYSGTGTTTYSATIDTINITGSVALPGQELTFVSSGILTPGTYSFNFTAFDCSMNSGQVRIYLIDP